MDNIRNDVAEKLQKANNILVTVSRNPSVDQLSALIGTTLLLNKMGKHAAAVFSGQVPSTIEFLQPEKTLEKNTDSLRDFIISLDKSKADKLRYKVQDDMVKIFITPYRTSLSQDDLEFSQGDFNVEVVFALGVHEQSELDQAITAHGRILHDAAVISVNKEGEGRLGSVNWTDPNASSLCEMVAGLAPKLKEKSLDNQMATAFLTGIVAETERFSNDKTSPATMQVSSQLMSAGANQQLVATQLQQPESTPLPEPQEDDGSQVQAAPPAKPRNDGALEIDHGQPEGADQDQQDNSEIHIDEHGQLRPHPGEQPADAPAEAPQQEPTEPEQSTEPEQGQEDQQPPSSSQRRPMAMEPPRTGGKLTANSEPEGYSPAVDVFGDGAQRSGDQPSLSRRNQPDTNKTLGEIEKDVDSPHVQQQTQSSQQSKQQEQASQPPQEQKPEEPAQPEQEQSPGLDEARDAVASAMGQAQQPPAPSAQEAQGPPPAPQPQPQQGDGQLNVHPEEAQPQPPQQPQQPQVTDQNAPPPVPPPMMPPTPYDGTQGNNQNSQ